MALTEFGVTMSGLTLNSLDSLARSQPSEDSTCRTTLLRIRGTTTKTGRLGMTVLSSKLLIGTKELTGQES